MRFVQAGVMLLGAFAYVSPFALSFIEGYAESIWYVIIGYNLLLLIVTVLVIIDSVRKVRAGQIRELVRGVFLVKLAAIPFFVINFAAMALLALGGTVLLVKGIGIAILAVVAVATVSTYLTMISTSVYGWAAVAALRKEHRIDRKRTALYAILLLVFVADTVAAAVLHSLYGRDRVAGPVSGGAPAPAIEGES